MSELFGGNLYNRKEALKDLIKRIHRGEDVEELKKRFRETFEMLKVPRLPRWKRSL